MNVYHIAYAPMVRTVYLHFWGCNLRCRACFCQKEIYDLHLEQTKNGVFDETKKIPQVPERLLDLEEVMQILGTLEIRQVYFMGAEPTIDPQLSQLAVALHTEFGSYNTLVTNGFGLPSLKAIDDVLFSIKAHTNNLHRHYTGKSNKRSLENFVRVYQSGTKLRVESIFIPEYIDYSEIENIARFIAEVDKSIPYHIDCYIPIGDNPWRRPTPEEVEEAATVAKRHLLNVSYLTGHEDLKFEVLRIF